jgi:hypothetical protein
MRTSNEYLENLEFQLLRPRPRAPNENMGDLDSNLQTQIVQGANKSRL